MSTDDARLYREGRRRLRNWLAVAELEADKAEGETTFNALKA